MMSTQVAIIGAGFMGATHAQGYVKAPQDVKIKYIADASLERASALVATLPYAVQAVDDLDVVLTDAAIDAVDVCVPTGLHAGLVTRAAQAKKHILCEKPIALKLDDADAMIRVCREQQVCFMVGHVLRFWPEYVAAVELIETGRIGAIRQIHCTRLSAPPSWSPTSWFLDAAQSGGAICDLAIHDFNVLQWLAGTPTTVTASGEPFAFTTLLEFPDHVTGTVTASYRLPQGFPFFMGFRIIGEQGMIEFDGRQGGLTLFAEGEQQQLTVDGSRVFSQDTCEARDGFSEEIAYFLHCIRNNEPPVRACPEDARDSLAMALQVAEALAKTPV